MVGLLNLVVHLEVARLKTVGLMVAVPSMVGLAAVQVGQHNIVDVALFGLTTVVVLVAQTLMVVVVGVLVVG